jgi:hypothetical protein
VHGASGSSECVQRGVHPGDVRQTDCAGGRPPAHVGPAACVGVRAGRGRGCLVLAGVAAGVVAGRVDVTTPMRMAGPCISAQQLPAVGNGDSILVDGRLARQSRRTLGVRLVISGGGAAGGLRCPAACSVAPTLVRGSRARGGLRCTPLARLRRPPLRCTSSCAAEKRLAFRFETCCARALFSSRRHSLDRLRQSVSGCYLFQRQPSVSDRRNMQHRVSLLSWLFSAAGWVGPRVNAVWCVACWAFCCSRRCLGSRVFRGRHSIGRRAPSDASRSVCA